MMRLVSRRVNLALLALLSVAFLTGWVAFSAAGSSARLVLVGHAAAGLGLLLLVPWKSLVVRRGLRRARPGRWASLLLAGLLGVSLTAGLLHFAGLPWWGPVLTAMDFHVGAAVAAVPLVVWHVLRRPVALRATDLSRRNLLRSGALAGAALAAYAAGEGAIRLARLPGATRALTGSYEVGSFRPEQMPVSSWTIDPVLEIDVDAWRLRVAGRVLTFDAVDGFGDRVRAILDCTGGFWSEQDWSGALLSRLIDADALAGAGSVRVVSATGYQRRFPLDQLSRLLLATRAGGAPLSPGHGAPARLVVPGGRGFWWVKWVVRIEPDPLPPWLQSPFPIH